MNQKMNMTNKRLCHIMGYEIQIMILYSVAIILRNRNFESDSSDGVLDTVIDLGDIKFGIAALS